MFGDMRAVPYGGLAAVSRGVGSAIRTGRPVATHFDTSVCESSAQPVNLVVRNRYVTPPSNASNLFRWRKTIRAGARGRTS